MQPPFDFVHLDPSQDPPESYQAAFELFGELWAKLRSFQSSCAQDRDLLTLIRHLEHHLVIAGLVLTIKVDMLGDR